MKKLDIFLLILIYAINTFNIIMGIIYLPQPYAYFQLSVGIVLIVFFTLAQIWVERNKKKLDEYFRKERERIENFRKSMERMEK